jgi:hypothetical protein
MLLVLSIAADPEEFTIRNHIFATGLNSVRINACVEGHSCPD